MAPLRALLRKTTYFTKNSIRFQATVRVIGAQPHFHAEHYVGTPSNKNRPGWKAPHEAVELVHPGDNIFVHGMSATPTPLLEGLCRHALERGLHNITLHHLYLEGKTPWTDSKFNGVIRSNSLFTGANMRKAVNAGVADFNSVFLSEIPWLFRKRCIELDVAMVSVSQPDKKGYCSLGPCVDATRAAIMNSKHIIGLANPNMPRTLGDSVVHSSHFDVLAFSDMLPHERPVKPISEMENDVGKAIADNLVEDGATLQTGIGAIPDACLGALKNHRDMGLHTEMFSDGVLELVNCGAITNAQKKIHPGKIVGSFVYGSQRLYEFLHDNPMIYMGDIQWVNDTSIIRQNPKVTAINSAIEVDLTGQVVADSIGKTLVSGFGGQTDFIRGAALCSDGRGKPIIALLSQTKNGESKIVPYIKDGAGVVTTRASAHYIVTENGIAHLFGKNMRQRAYEMIRIAHPNHRESLEKESYERLKCMPSPD